MTRMYERFDRTFGRTRSGRDSDRIAALIVYILYGVTLFSAFPSIIGVIIAYWARGGARGSVYESHFDNQIAAFWIFAICVVTASLLWFVWFLILPVPIALLIGGIGWLVLAWKTLKGGLRLLADRPYS